MNARVTAAMLAADSADGEWWALLYLLAFIREQARGMQ